MSPIMDSSNFDWNRASKRWGDLYDSFKVATADTQISAFVDPIGAGTSAWQAGVKRLNDTNMRQGRSLPATQKFDVHQLVLLAFPKTGTGASDIITALYSMSLTLKIGGVKLYEGPAKFLTGGAGVDGFAATTTAATIIEAAHNGVASPMAVYSLPSPFSIPPLVGIEAVFERSGADGTITTAVAFTFALRGFHYEVIGG